MQSDQARPFPATPLLPLLDSVKYAMLSGALDECLLSVPFLWEQTNDKEAVLLQEHAALEAMLFTYLNRRRNQRSLSQAHLSDDDDARRHHETPVDETKIVLFRPYQHDDEKPNSSALEALRQKVLLQGPLLLRRRASLSQNSASSAVFPSSLVIPTSTVVAAAVATAAAAASARRNSVFFGDEGLDTLALILQPSSLKFRSFTETLDVHEIKDLASSYLDAIRLSDGVREAVTVWFESKFPQRIILAGGGDNGDVMRGVLENVVHLLVAVGELIRPALKMARIGIAAKLVVSITLTYADISSDVMVTKSYYERGMMLWFRISAALILAALFVQVVIIFFQYRPGGVKRWAPRVLAAMLGLSHLLESASVWTGNEGESEHTLVPGLLAVGMLKASEVAIESIGQGVCQTIAVLQLSDAEEISPVFLVSICLSFVSIGFAMTEVNVSMGTTIAGMFPGNPYNHWCPSVHDAPRRRVMFVLGMFVFETTYCFLFVVTLVSLFFMLESFLIVGSLLAAEFSTLLAIKLYLDEVPVMVLPHVGNVRDYVLGSITLFVYYMMANSCPMVVQFQPGRLGPSFHSVLVVHRYISSIVVMYFAIPHLVEKTWLSTSTAWGIYLTALSLALRCRLDAAQSSTGLRQDAALEVQGAKRILFLVARTEEPPYLKRGNDGTPRWVRFRIRCVDHDSSQLLPFRGLLECGSGGR